MNDRSDFPASIRARVHDGAIDRVTRFFNASASDAFVELIQNTRRSGATRLDVATEAIPAGGIRVTVTDDGDGIADPAVLLSFGESGWDAETAEREDPAGIGVYALSKRGCSVSSRPRTAIGEHAPGWARRAHTRLLPRQGHRPPCSPTTAPLAPRHRHLVHGRRDPGGDSGGALGCRPPLPTRRHRQR